MIIQDLKANTA